MLTAMLYGLTNGRPVSDLRHPSDRAKLTHTIIDRRLSLSQLFLYARNKDDWKIVRLYVHSIQAVVGRYVYCVRPFDAV